jgi:DNA-binding response OmpR family regulator
MLKKMLRRGARVLVLDDDTSMQKLVSALLRKEGYRVDVFSGGNQAIASLADRQYDAMLLDVMTPTEGGLTVIRHLRESQPDMLKRIVLVTASPDSVLRAVEGDVFAIVRKPFDADELISTIRRVLAQ